MEKLSRNRLFPFHSVRCLKSFAKQDVHHCFDSLSIQMVTINI